MIRLYELHKCPEKYVGDIEVSGWIKTARESKNVGFIELGDGSAFRSVQVVGMMITAKFPSPFQSFLQPALQ